MSESEHPEAPSSRRGFLKSSAIVAAAAGAGLMESARAVPPGTAPPSAGNSKKDPYALAVRFNKFLRVTDVADGLDAVGLAGLTLMDPAIRPLWMGMRFFGPAVTMRIVPTNRRMPRVAKEDALKQHAIWKQMGGWHVDLEPHLKPGCVIVMSTGGAQECGYWGSNNSLDMMSRGVRGIVTEGNCRDTDEVVLQKCNVACRGIGRTIIPGRVELVEVETPVGCGGAMVRPGDIVGCDWDGCLVVPIEAAEEVLAVSARIAVDDKQARRRLYDRMGRKPDESVEWEAAAEYFKDLLK
jgi:4-hydroxy-4-methyl-2-oxoglutarate aldolase